MELICDSTQCTPNETHTALALLQQQVEQVFDENATYTPYDPLVGPSQDVHWPSIVAYGNCDSCYVQMPASIASPQNLMLMLDPKSIDLTIFNTV